MTPTIDPFIFPEEEGYFACLLLNEVKCQDIRLTTPGKTGLFVTKTSNVVMRNAVQNQVFEPEANLIIRIESIT